MLLHYILSRKKEGIHYIFIFVLFYNWYLPSLALFTYTNNTKLFSNFFKPVILIHAKTQDCAHLFTMISPCLAHGEYSSKSESHSFMSNSLRPYGLYSPWNSPSQNTGVGSLPLFQGMLPTQGLNPGLLQCSQILYQLSHKGSPRILEWVAYPFSSRSSQPRNWTRVSCIARGFFTNWAVREAPILNTYVLNKYHNITKWMCPQ